LAKLTDVLLNIFDSLTQVFSVIIFILYKKIINFLLFVIVLLPFFHYLMTISIMYP